MENPFQPDAVDPGQIYDHIENFDGYDDVFRRFMPSSSIYELTTEKKVLSTLRLIFKGEDVMKLASFVIENDARRIFLCLAWINGLHYLPEFMDADFTDKDLPVVNRKNVKKDTPLSGEQLFDEAPSNIERPAKNFPLEGKGRRIDRLQLLEKQWVFLSPDCSDGSLKIHVFHPKCPMAYLPPSSSDFLISSCKFSVVRRVYLHPDHFRHHKLSSTAEGSSKVITAALKILTVRGASSNVSDHIERFYDVEARAFQKLVNINHGHLISPISIYKSGQDRCFLFPWAHGGNLNEFWRSFDRSDSIDFVAWSLDQMHGMFEGLSKLHQQIISHGDIKPNNILHFPQNCSGTASGRLAIADVGLANSLHSSFADRDIYSSTPMFTLTYQPPPNMKGQRSRLFDYWSLGCVFLEFMIWIYDGYDGIYNFRMSLFHPQHDLFAKAAFWDSDWSQRPKLNTVVEDTMNKLQKRNSPLSEMANELIELIRTKLLNIDAYHGEQVGTWNKKNAEGVLNEIIAIREKYIKSDKCLWQSLLANHRVRSELVNKWWLVRDIDSATSLLSQLDWPSLRPEIQSPAFCLECRKINFDQLEWNLHRNIRDLERGSHDCALCRFFVQTIADANLMSEHPVILVRDKESPVVRLAGQNSPVISLYSEPDLVDERAPPPGLPLLPEMGSLQQNRLLNAWINLCNETHDCTLNLANSSTPGSHMPTRLISVGHDHTSPIRLVESTELSEDKFMALSHRWGELSDQEMVRTTASNIDDFKKEIRFESLPQSFRDAVKLARAIEVPFLWIDSLCIIQGDEEDWAREAARMEDVFSFAYCVIAATSAKSSLEGFLGDRKPRPSVAVGSSNNRMYLSKYIDDFKNDVEHGPLNKRGWVLQERALARRTIHITSTQIYWECGQGIYCETLAQLKNPQTRFLGDAHFPESSFQYYKYKDERIRLIQHIQELYSGLTLGYLADRPKAMLGIEKRIARVFKSQARYGIYGTFFARTMLWQASVAGGLTRIDPMGGKRVPSWSWMSYSGRITYVDVPFKYVLWFDNLKNPFDTGQSLESWDEHLFGRANNLVYLWEYMRRDEYMGDIVLDYASDQNERHAWKCVLLGRDDENYYALIIRPVIAGDSSRYERVGVGRLSHTQISHDETQDVVII